MLNSTALFTEYLVIGTSAWLWLMPLILAWSHLRFEELSERLTAGGTLELGILVLVTYALGVLLESVSFAFEKLAVGRTSNHRRWFTVRFGDVAEHDWHAAQEFIWSSDGAYQEFVYSRLRVAISRGVLLNSSMAFVCGLCLPLVVGNGIEQSGALVVASGLFGGLAFFSWWSATLEYRARVRVAGELAKTKTDVPLSSAELPSSAETQSYRGDDDLALQVEEPDEKESSRTGDLT